MRGWISEREGLEREKDHCAGENGYARYLDCCNSFMGMRLCQTSPTINLYCLSHVEKLFKTHDMCHILKYRKSRNKNNADKFAICWSQLPSGRVMVFEANSCQQYECFSFPLESLSPKAPESGWVFCLISVFTTRKS